MANKITAVCQECNVQFEYELKPGFPRKYCVPCGEKRKASFANKEPLSGLPTTEVPGIDNIAITDKTNGNAEPKVRNTRTAEEITATELTKIVYKNTEHTIEPEVVLHTYVYF